jgi:WD40 repeat protein
VLNYRPVLEIAPLQVYNSALLFSPMKSNIKLMFSKDVPVWIKRLPKLPETWSASLQLIDSSRFPTIAFSRDGQFLAHTSKAPWRVDLRDPKTGALRITLDDDILEGYTLLEFSPDSKLLACASVDPTFEIWDLKTRKVRVIEGHSGAVNALAFSPDGKSLVTASSDKSVRFWNPHTGESKAIFTGHSSNVHDVAFSPNGQLIASASYGNNIRLWSPVTRESCGILRGHLDRVCTIAFSPDSRRIASGSGDKTVRLWDLSTLTSLKLTGHYFAVYAVSFSPNGQLIISGSILDGMIRLWDPKTGASLAVFEYHSDGVNSIAFSPDGRLFASASNDKTVRIWNATTRQLHTTLEGHSAKVYDVMFSPDGRLVASASSDRTVRLWDPQVVIPGTNIERHSQRVSRVAFSLDGQLLASSSDDETIKIWDPFTGTLYRTFEGHMGYPDLIEFSPDGKMLASADNHTIRIWNLYIGISLKTLKIDSSRIKKLSFSPSSKLLASGARERVIDWEGVGTTGDRTKRREDPSSYRDVRVWDTNTGDCYCGFTCDLYEGHVATPGLDRGLEALVFSQDEKLLAALTEGKIWIWNLETKELIQKLDRQEVTLQQPLFDLVSESKRDTSRDMLTRNFPSLRLDQSEFERALYVKEHWVTWRKKRLLWLPPEYRGSCFRVRDNILAMGHRSGRVTFMEFDLDRNRLGGSMRNEL